LLLLTIFPEICKKIINTTLDTKSKTNIKQNYAWLEKAVKSPKINNY